MQIFFFDTETTGNAERDRLIQLAIKERGNSAPVINALYKAPLPIAIEAMAVHHITEKMCEGRPCFVDADEYPTIKELLEHGDTVAVAHNAAFDMAMLARESIYPKKVICTYKVVRALDPEEKIGQHKLQYLRYYLGLDIEGAAHDALGDVLVLEGLFERLLAKMIEHHGDERAAIEEMIAISAQPLYFSTIRFGKYKGKKIADIVQADRAYIEWLLREKRQKPEGEQDWIATLEHYLKAAQ